MPHRTRPIHFFCILLVFTFILTACSNVPTQSSNAHPVQQKRTTQSTPIFMPGGPVTYVALGASDAVGIGSNIPGSQGYVPLVAAHLPKKSHLINLGISGIQLHEALSQELPLALTTSPNLITIWLVANDFIGGVTYDNYLHDLNTLLQQLHVSTHARIVLANLPDLTRLPAFANETPSQKAQMLVAIQKWNKEIAQLAKKYAVAVCGLFSQRREINTQPRVINWGGVYPHTAGDVH